MALVDKETGTLIGGDLLFLDRAATTPDADLDAWRESLDRLEEVAASGIVPGHGPIDRDGRSIQQTTAISIGSRRR